MPHFSGYLAADELYDGEVSSRFAEVRGQFTVCAAVEVVRVASNAVERSNRRHRKMQKLVYRVRTKGNVTGRHALDLQRERQANGRQQTTERLHRQREAGK